jgi:hypothetical protein
LYSIGGNVEWCSPCKRVWRFLKKLKIVLQYDPAIPLPGIFPKEMISVHHAHPVYCSTIHNTSSELVSTGKLYCICTVNINQPLKRRSYKKKKKETEKRRS